MVNLLHQLRHRADLDAYFRGEVSPIAARVVLDRVGGCSACRSRYSRHLLHERSLPDGEDLRAARLWQAIRQSAGLAVQPAVVARPLRPLKSIPRLLLARRWAVAATLLLIASGASAAWWRFAPERPGPQPHSTPEAAPRKPRTTARTSVQTPAPVEKSPEMPPVPPPEMPQPEQRGQVQAPPPVLAARTRPDAATLFQEANRARGERRFDRAIALYKTLQDGQPATREATLSFLSMGDLYLERGQVKAALAAYDAYLKTGDATVAEEALVGKARALHAQGHTSAEQAVWKLLLARYPQSDYRWRAQQRLDLLNADARQR